MSNRFIFFFLSTFIMLSVYFSFENTVELSTSSLDIILYIFDYFLFVGYLSAKYIVNKKTSFLLIILAYSLLIIYSFLEQSYLVNKNNTVWTHFFFLFHIVARTLILCSFLFEIKIPKKIIVKNIYFTLVIIAVLVFSEWQIVNIYGAAKYNFKIHLILYIVEIFILNIALINNPKNKSLYYIFVISAVFSILTDFLSIQNQIYFTSIFEFPITRIGNTLAELGLVYAIISVSESSFSLNQKHLKNGL